MMKRIANSPHTSARGARAFTVVEMLIVVAIVILLLSILIVALNAAARSSQSASTAVRMETMKRGIVQFKTDMGYYPPVLNAERDLINLPSHDPVLFEGAYIGSIQDYYSLTAMADYLTGWDGRDNDGYGVMPGGSTGDTERPPFGIRNPLRDGVWNATVSGGGGTLEERMPEITGDVFGPYLEMDDPELLGAIDPENLMGPGGRINVLFPGDADYNETLPKVIVDYWGQPIQYYRRPYPIGGIRHGFTKVDRDGNGTIDFVPSLGDIFVLRPFNIPTGTDISSRYPDGAGDTATTAALNSAEFALLSAGPDLSVNRALRYDDPDQQTGVGIPTSYVNRDNIVELGP